MPQTNVRKFKPKKKDVQPFWQELEEMLQSCEDHDLDEGHMKGSLSGESWKAFLKMVSDEVLERLEAYRRESERPVSGFCASSLGSYREEKKKIERAYLRNLVVLYKSAERAYKTVSG